MKKQITEEIEKIVECNDVFPKDWNDYKNSLRGSMFDIAYFITKNKKTDQLWAIVHELIKEKWSEEVHSLLWWICGTIHKWYDDEEEADTIIQNCKEWENNPKCFD